jgi:hypothetical protein
LYATGDHLLRAVPETLLYSSAKSFLKAFSVPAPPMFVIITNPKSVPGQNIAVARFMVFDPVCVIGGVAYPPARQSDPSQKGGPQGWCPNFAYGNPVFACCFGPIQY